MQSYMELIYIDSDDQARQTGMRRSLDTNAATWAEFQSYRGYGVAIEDATFLLDYHTPNGDLGPTIPLDDAGFIAVTGRTPLNEAAYVKVDETFWADVAAQRTAA